VRLIKKRPALWIYFVPASILLPLCAALIALKIIHIDALRGDSAIYFQTARNIAAHGTPTSSLFTHVLFFVQSHLPKMTASAIAASPLLTPPGGNENILRLHSYFVLFPIGLFAKIIPVEWLLPIVFALSFVGLVYLAVVMLLRRSIPAWGAAIFGLMVMTHPAWGESILFGQFYPDRIFVLSGFVFMALASRERAPRWAFIAVGLLCASINERGALTAGGALLLYTLLYWRTVPDRTFKLVTSVALVVFGELMLKVVVVNSAYSTFLPTSLHALLKELQQPHFVNGILVLLLVNAALFAIAFFEWRAALVALVVMLPNVFGNIGGAEKTGWSTHYHSFYFPILVWAALLGFVRAYHLACERRVKWLFYCGAVAALLLIGSIVPFAGVPEIALTQLAQTFVPTVIEQVQTFVSPRGVALYRLGQEVAAAVPEGASVTTPEAGMPFLYHERSVYFFPMNIDTADYAVLAVWPNGNGYTYGGAVSFLGAAELSRVNNVILKRMRKDGYDLNHPHVIPGLGIAIVKRKKR